MIRMDVVEPIVYEILQERPITRSDDQLLYIAYWCKESPNVPFLEFFKNYKKYNCRSYKTIERVRRKLQRKFPELADKKTQLKRYELEREYKEYARNRGGLWRLLLIIKRGLFLRYMRKNNVRKMCSCVLINTE